MVRKSVVKAILVLSLAFSTAAWAQYPGPTGMGGTTGGTSGAPTYTKKSYGVNKAAMGALIGGGVGAGVFLLARHRHHGTMTACVGSDGKTLDDGKNVYNVLGSTLTPNEHLVLAGKKATTDTGEPGLEVTAIRKDLGQCEQPAVSARK
jgi:hypothetical protein